MLSETCASTIEPPSRLLLMLEARALGELGTLWAYAPLRFLAPMGDGHPVLVLPGLAAEDISTVPLRLFLRDRGYRPYGWGLGRNTGQRTAVRQLVGTVQGLQREHGRKVSLVGWSMGGIFAREIAKAVPDAVRCVVTLGSPFAGPPQATNAWRIYEWLSGEQVPDRRLHEAFRSPPPVPATSIYSRTDGVVAWQCCLEEKGPQTENIEVEGSHCGLVVNPAVFYAVADRLAQREGEWQPFDYTGLKRLVYGPGPERAGVSRRTEPTTHAERAPLAEAQSSALALGQ
jgi:hypothetical protein